MSLSRCSDDLLTANSDYLPVRFAGKEYASFHHSVVEVGNLLALCMMVAATGGDIKLLLLGSWIIDLAPKVEAESARARRFCFDQAAAHGDNGAAAKAPESPAPSGEATFATDVGQPGVAKSKKNVRKLVNARMLEEIQSNLEAMGWNCRRWAQELKCVPSSVVATDTWNDLKMCRDRNRAERAMDRHRRSKPKQRD